MQLNLRIRNGEWGNTLDDAKAVAETVIGAFSPGLPNDWRFDIVLERHSSPMAVSSWLSERREYIVHVGCSASLMNQFAFQLAHEFTHVIADSISFEVDRFAWLEESLAETGSLFALHGLAKTWFLEPPRPGWQWYHLKFGEYADERLNDPQHFLPAGADFKQWLAESLPSLEAKHDDRERNTIIASHLLPGFERDPTAWRAIRYLHGFKRPEGMTFPHFLKSWRDACPNESQRTVDAIAEILGVSYPARPRLRRQPTTALQYVEAIRSAVSKPRPAPRPTSLLATPSRKPKGPASSAE